MVNSKSLLLDGRCCSVTKSCSTLWDPMDCSTPGFPVFHYLLEFAQTHVHWVGDAIQPSHPLSSPSPPTLNLSQHQGLFPTSRLFASSGQCIGASASASVLPMNIQGWFPLGLTGMISLLAKDYYFKYWNKRRGKTLFCTFWEYQGGKTGLWDMHTEKSRMNSPFTEECTQWHRSPFGEPWLWEPMENEAEGPPRWQKTTWCMMTLLSTPLSSSTKLPKSGGACAQSWQQAQVHRREGRPGICRSLGEKCGLQQAIMLSKPISEMQWGPQVRSEFSWEQFENKNHVKVISVGDMLSS